MSDRPKRKRPSGAEFRKAKKAREKAEAIAKAKALGVPLVDANPVDFADEFREAGEPDLENQGTDLAYVRKLQLIALRQMATTPNPSELQQALWKRIREMSAVVGMTSNRAGLEAEVRTLKQMLADQRAKLGTAKMVNGAGIAIPATSRHSGLSRGPRAIPDDGASPPKGEG